MSLRSLLTEPVTLRYRTAAAPDAEGNPVSTTSDTDTVGRLEQRSTNDQEGGDRRSTGSVLFLGPDEVVDGATQVLAGGRTFEVEGSPNLASTPRGPHHWEVTLREVTP